MKTHSYILEPYKGSRSRYECPGCGHKHKFTRYIDTATGEQVAHYVGRCDRENSCGYHYSPKQFFADNPGSGSHSQKWKRSLPSQKIICTTNYLPFDVFEKSVIQHERCNLFPFLAKLFRKDIAKWLCENYFIGTNREGHTVFWQVDIKGNIRQAKVMQYDSSTGRRNKEAGAVFAGKAILKNKEANLQQCFFGEYLLSLPENQKKTVAIVESEKTAVIASIYYPQFVFIATGGKHGCKWTGKNVCSILKGRNVVLFPDVGAYHSWYEKGIMVAKAAGCKVVISDILEKNARESEMREGLDIADYLLGVRDNSGLALTDYKYPVMFDFNFFEL